MLFHSGELILLTDRDNKNIFSSKQMSVYLMIECNIFINSYAKS